MISGALGMLTLLEVVRAGLHAGFPYESHTEVSGMADAIGLTGVYLDAVALVTFQFGFASVIASAGYLIPFLFGDANRHISLFLLGVSFLSRVLQSANFAF